MVALQSLARFSRPLRSDASSGTRERRLGRLQIRAGLVIDLHGLDRCPVDLDEGDGHAAAWTIRLDDDVLTLEGGRKVIAPSPRLNAG
jgi:hypothetical protein